MIRWWWWWWWWFLNLVSAGMNAPGILLRILEDSKRFWKIPVWKMPENSGKILERFRKEILEDSGNGGIRGGRDSCEGCLGWFRPSVETVRRANNGAASLLSHGKVIACGDVISRCDVILPARARACRSGRMPRCHIAYYCVTVGFEERERERERERKIRNPVINEKRKP